MYTHARMQYTHTRQEEGSMDFGRNGQLILCGEDGVQLVQVRHQLQQLDLPGAGGGVGGCLNVLVCVGVCWCVYDCVGVCMIVLVCSSPATPITHPQHIHHHTSITTYPLLTFTIKPPQHHHSQHRKQHAHSRL